MSYSAEATIGRNSSECLNIRGYQSRDRRKRDVCIRLRWDKLTRRRVQPRNRMRENRTSGTVCGVSGNRHSYHDGFMRTRMILKLNKNIAA